MQSFIKQHHTTGLVWSKTVSTEGLSLHDLITKLTLLLQSNVTGLHTAMEDDAIELYTELSSLITRNPKTKYYFLLLWRSFHSQALIFLHQSSKGLIFVHTSIFSYERLVT